MRTSRLAAVIVGVVTLALTSGQTRADVDPRSNGVRVAFGVGGAGRSVAGQRRPALPLELTLVMNPMLTTSLGAVVSDARLAHAYAELGAYFLFSLGAGFGYGAYGAGPQGVKNGPVFHLFAGLPIPLHSPADFIDAPWCAYLLPYYRPSWGPWSGAAHELGLMFKVSYGLVRGSAKIGG